MLPLLVDLLGQHDTNNDTVVVQVEPYTMCSRQECDERVRTNEVSLFERISTTSDSSSSSWPIDPCKAVCKYRRSAAGCFTDGDSTRAPPRGLAALNITVAYLVQHILIEGCRRPPCSIGEGDKDSATTAATTTIPFLSRVAFFEDRMRAVQVDLVRSQVVASQLQVLAVRSQILILYLLADVNHTTGAGSSINKMVYEHSFSQSALQTAFSGYWGSIGEFDHTDEDKTTRCNRYDDEIMALTLLVQLNQQLVAEQAMTESVTANGESNHSALSLSLALAELVRKAADTKAKHGSSTLLFGKPRFQWTLRLVSYCSLGLWQTALQSIVNGCSDIDDDDETFAILARCCLAPSIPYLQWRVLQLYNMTLLKNEAMTGAELARLLHVAADRVQPTSTFDDNDDPNTSTRLSSQAALDVAHVSYGLPLNDSRDAVLFKVQPIQPMPSPTMTLMRIRDNDSIVLGVNHHELYTSCDDGIPLPSAEWIERLLFL